LAFVHAVVILIEILIVVAIYTALPFALFAASVIVKGAGVGPTTVGLVGLSLWALILNAIIASDSPSFFTDALPPLVILSWPIYAVGVFYHFGDDIFSLNTPSVPASTAMVRASMSDNDFADKYVYENPVAIHSIPLHVSILIGQIFGLFYMQEPRPIVEE
jgi:hypothetical protein